MSNFKELVESGNIVVIGTDVYIDSKMYRTCSVELFNLINTTLKSEYSDHDITYVSSIKYLNNARNIAQLIKDDNISELEIACKLVNIPFPNDYILAKKNTSELKDAFLASVNTVIEASKTKYSFREVPVDYTFAAYFDIYQKRSIRRKHSLHRTIGLITLKRIWEIASKAWHEYDQNEASTFSPIPLSSVRSDGYSYNSRVTRSGIEVGCQTIERWEIEQVAVELGWDIPA